MCFPVNIAKFLRTYLLKNICERLLPWTAYGKPLLRAFVSKLLDDILRDHCSLISVNLINCLLFSHDSIMIMLLIAPRLMSAYQTIVLLISIRIISFLAISHDFNLTWFLERDKVMLFQSKPEISATKLLIIRAHLNVFCTISCIKYRYFTYFPGMEILWKPTVSVEFRSQNFHTKKVDEIFVFCSEKVVLKYSAELVGRHLQWSLFLTNYQRWCKMTSAGKKISRTKS